ncbi:transposase domain protein (plasmid) [Bacillus cereus]|nr:transposase domain protein [Bacillus cereus]
MPHLRKTHRYFSMFFYNVQDATINFKKKKRELSEYKAIGMIQDHLYILYQAIQQNTRRITKILIRLFHLLQKNGQKSHRYEKKTIFDIMGVAYEYNGLRKQKKIA